MGIDFKRPRHIRGFRFGEALVWDFTSRPLVEKTVSGAIATFSDGADAVPLKKCEVTLPASLDGYSEVDVVSAGKNLFNVADYSQIYTDRDGIDTYSYRYMIIHLKPNTTYTVSQNSGEAKSTPIILINSVLPVGGSNYLDLRTASGSKTYTTGDDGYLYIGSVNSYDDVAYARLQECNIQIEAGSSATTYEPYEEPTTYDVDIPNPNPNLFDKIGGTYTIGRWKTDGTVKSGVGVRAYKIAISEKTDYVINGEAFCAVAQSQFVVFFDANDNFISYVPFTHTDYTAKVTSPANSAYIGVTWDGLLQSVNDSVKEAFDVYGGTADVVKGQGTSTEKGKWLSELTWTQNASYPHIFNGEGFTDRKKNINWDNSTCLSDRYTGYTSSSIVTQSSGIALGTGATSTRIYVSDDRFETVADFVASLQTDDSFVVLPLETHETFTFDPVPIDSKLGTNNIWNDSGDTEVTYYAYAD